MFTRRFGELHFNGILQVVLIVVTYVTLEGLQSYLACRYILYNFEAILGTRDTLKKTVTRTVFNWRFWILIRGKIWKCDVRYVFTINNLENLEKTQWSITGINLMIFPKWESYVYYTVLHKIVFTTINNHCFCFENFCQSEYRNKNISLSIIIIMMIFFNFYTLIGRSFQIKNNDLLMWA